MYYFAQFLNELFCGLYVKQTKIGLNFEKCKCSKEYYRSSVAALVTFCSLELSVVKQLLFSLSLSHCINCLGLGLEFRVFVCLFVCLFFWGGCFLCLFVCLFFCANQTS